MNTNNQENKKDLSEAMRQAESKFSGSPSEKYHAGSIQEFHKEATKNGPYESYSDMVIKDAVKNATEYSAQTEETKKATFKGDPKRFLETGEIKEE